LQKFLSLKRDQRFQKKAWTMVKCLFNSETNFLLPLNYVLINHQESFEV